MSANDETPAPPSERPSCERCRFFFAADGLTECAACGDSFCEDCKAEHDCPAIEERKRDEERRASLRSAPQEKEADVFEAFATGLGRVDMDLRVKIRARDWFGPLVEIVREVYLAPYRNGEAILPVALTVRAQHALARLRSRAEAGA